MLFFGLVYVVEGIGQTGGIIAQPLSYYLKEVYAWTPVQVTGFLTVFNFPWIIKPVYGLVSDFLPLFGYRRKSYLIVANALATFAYLLVATLAVPGQLLFALLLTAYAMAISSTLCGALLVENGQRFGASGAVVNQQWLWFNVAAMCASLAGGELIDLLPPTSALHGAALIAGAASLSSSAPSISSRRKGRASISPSSKTPFAACSPRSAAAGCGWSGSICSSTISVPASPRRSTTT